MDRRMDFAASALAMMTNWRQNNPPSSSFPQRGSSVPDVAVLRSWRDHLPPSASVFKLSQLTTVNNRNESSVFSSGGYSWRLVVYPRGNEEENGKGFVSMYVELDKSCLSSISAPPTEVSAYLSFFVFNKKENKYFSVQDVEVKKFSSSRTVWGVSQVLPVEAFSDPANGYILEGEEHEFGAHVKIAPSPVAAAENLPFHKFSWSVRDFSLLKQSDYVSKTFQMGEKKWTLTVYPKGDSRAEGKLSSYVHLAEGENLLTGELIFVRAKVQVLDPRGSNHLSMWLKSWVMTSSTGVGLPQSMPLAKIQEGYLDHEDTLNVEMECEVVNTIKDHPFF
ncbi:PREDICTED: uncharacterized protein LOC104787101 [Camelina sativa]|uniref:Uncharacterized protein LOC104787101 n=1 Tax=Camelina sativa TaxID=90675 RepID=A0ABM0Z616_CAMSA|nr:PREDICTED: uncharacterized protein LOC104787101 [Camelina sativa]XP_010510920.1 PREDICTED: uncharacterized protein LOC104787101 [Camelina sativa]XP_010510921.1 PREDICTED: uncharacterized protein LOC104787101 [Camelina sativa]XP_010510922.1 PREDICTED: uncharacterized protein LOC104787101 [Camelina sativa]